MICLNCFKKNSKRNFYQFGAFSYFKLCPECKQRLNDQKFLKRRELERLIQMEQSHMYIRIIPFGT